MRLARKELSSLDAPSSRHERSADETEDDVDARQRASRQARHVDPTGAKVVSSLAVARVAADDGVNLVTFFDELAGERGADEAGDAGDERSHR